MICSLDTVILQIFGGERSRSVWCSLNFDVRGSCRDCSVCFSHLGVFLISVKPLTTENTENKTTPKICKITVLTFGTFSGPELVQMMDIVNVFLFFFIFYFYFFYFLLFCGPGPRLCT